MPATTTSKASLKSLAGGTLFVGGAVLAATHLGALALRFWNFGNNSLADLIGSCAGLGIASLHLLQSVMFDHAIVFSFVFRMLVSFTAIGILVAGLVLLRRQRGEGEIAARQRTKRDE